MKALNVGLLVISSVFYAGMALAAGEKVEQSVELPGSATVNLENMRGYVEIVGTSGNTATLTGTLDEKAEDFSMEMRGNTLFIKVEMPRQTRFNDDESEGSRLKLVMPSDRALDVQGVSMDIEVRDLSQATKIESVSGDIDARNLSGQVRLVSVSGDIKARQLAGEVQLDTVSGDINDQDSNATDVRYQGVSGDIYAITKARKVSVQNVSGDVELGLDEVNELSIKNVSGDFEVDLVLAANGQLKANNVSGDMNFVFHNGIDAQFDLAANAGGDIINKITDEKASKAKYGPSRSLNFRIGEGSATVDMSTVSGDIEISRSK